VFPRQRKEVRSRRRRNVLSFNALESHPKKRPNCSSLEKPCSARGEETLVRRQGFDSAEREKRRTKERKLSGE